MGTDSVAAENTVASTAGRQKRKRDQDVEIEGENAMDIDEGRGPRAEDMAGEVKYR